MHFNLEYSIGLSRNPCEKYRQYACAEGQNHDIDVSHFISFQLVSSGSLQEGSAQRVVLIFEPIECSVECSGFRSADVKDILLAITYSRERPNTPDVTLFLEIFLIS